MNAASLAQVKKETEALALCVAGVLCERDPSLLAAFRESAELLYHVLDGRGDREAAAMVSAFGRALVDPHSSVLRTSSHSAVADDQTSHDCRSRRLLRKTTRLSPAWLCP